MKKTAIIENNLSPKLHALEKIAPKSQIQAIITHLYSEEAQFFVDKVCEYAERFSTMPRVYECDGQGNKAIAHLHLFKGSCDFYITERDFTDEQLQAFGLADYGCGAELGYINIQELIENEVELDLHWTPKPLEEIKNHIGAL